MARTTPHDHTRSDGEPLYWRVAQQLLGELRDGTVPPGERLPGERELAGHFGVSRETVRQALEVLRRDGLVATDRRGSHATLPGLPVETAPSSTFPVGARAADPGTVDRTRVTWETPPPEHAEALGLAPHRPTLVHRYESAGADGRGRRTAVTSFSAVALSEVEELARYRDRADGAASAQLQPRLRLDAQGGPDPASPGLHHPPRGQALGAGHPARARPVRTATGDHRPGRGRPTLRPGL